MNPESYGIIDAPVSYIARFNLIQVAKILQTLAMRKYEPVEPKVADLYKHFEEDCLSSIINTLLENALSSTELDKEPSSLESNDQLKQMSHNVTAFFTEQQLHNLVSEIILVVYIDINYLLRLSQIYSYRLSSCNRPQITSCYLKRKKIVWMNFCLQ